MKNGNHDVTKLPKWAQKMIADAEAKTRQPDHNSLTGCHFEMVGVKHDEGTRDAIESVARAIEQNAIAATELAKSISGERVTLGPAVKIGGSNE